MRFASARENLPLVDPAPAAPVMEDLEQRQLLSAALSRGGTLWAVGKSGNDVITVSRDRRGSSYVLTVDGIMTVAPARSVRAISLAGGDGNDRIAINDRYGIITAGLI